MRKIFTTALLLFLFTHLVSETFGQTNRYRSFASGTWSVASNWENDVAGNGVYSISTVAPSATNSAQIIVNHAMIIAGVNAAVDQTTVNSGGSITVNASRTLSVANNVGTVNDLTISSGGVININASGNLGVSTAATLSLGGTINNNGTLAFAGTSTLIVEASGVLENNSAFNFTTSLASTMAGTFNNYGTYTISGGKLTVTGTLNNLGVIVNSVPSRLEFDSGAIYNHEDEYNEFDPQPATNIPVATWDPNSNLIINNVFASPGNLDIQEFGNFIWNNSLSDLIIDLGIPSLNIQGDFTVQSTGNNGALFFNSLGSTFVSVAGNFNIIDGNVGFSNETGDESSFILGNFDMSNGALGIANVGNTTVTVSGTFDVSGGSYIDLSAGVGVGTLIVNDFDKALSTTIEKTGFGSPSQILVSGNWQDAGSFNISGITVTFNGGASQTIDSPSSSSFDGLTINSMSDVTLTGANANYVVNGTLTLSSGNLSIGARTLTLTDSITSIGGTLTGSSSSNLVIGGSGPATLPEITGGLNNFTLNRVSHPINLSGPLNLTGYATLTAGTLNSDDYFSVDLNSGGINGIGAGTVTGNISVSKDLNTIQYFSSPLIGVPASDLSELQTLSSDNLMFYNEENPNPDKNWGFEYISNGATTFTPGRGYVFYGNSAGNLALTGSYDHGASPVSPVTYTNSGNNDADGWNLIGNPFPSAVDWDDVSLSAGVDNAVYFRDATNKRFMVYVGAGGTGTGIGANGGTDVVPAMQAVWVKASSNGSVTFNKASREDNISPATYRTAASRNILRIAVQGEGPSDETIIRFNDDATFDFDSKFDAYKFANSGTTPSLYTSLNSKDLAINTVPDFADSLIVPLNIKAQVNGNYVFTASELGTFTSDFQSIYLIDKALNVKQNLLTNPQYSAFINASDRQSGRFFITFRKHTTITGNDDAVNSRFYLSSKENILTAKFDEVPASSAHILINNLQGTTVYQLSNANISSGSISFHTGLTPGLYLIQVITENRVFAKKVYLN